MKRTVGMIIIGFVGLVSVILAAEPIEIEVGHLPDDSVLLYGWSPRGERMTNGGSMRWIMKSEGEMAVSLVGDTNYELQISAMPVICDQRIQNMGLFLNGHYIKEWVLGTNSVMSTYTAFLPAKWVKSGENSLLFRAGFVYRPEGDPRELSIALHTLLFTPKND